MIRLLDWEGNEVRQWGPSHKSETLFVSPEGVKKLNHAPSPDPPSGGPPSPPMGARELTLFFLSPGHHLAEGARGLRGLRDLLQQTFFHTFP